MKPVSHTSCDELYCCESCNKHPQLENEGVYSSGAFLICGMCHNRLMQSNCEVCGCSFQAFIRDRERVLCASCDYVIHLYKEPIANQIFIEDAPNHLICGACQTSETDLFILIPLDEYHIYFQCKDCDFEMVVRPFTIPKLTDDHQNEAPRSILDEDGLYVVKIDDVIFGQIRRVSQNRLQDLTRSFTTTEVAQETKELMRNSGEAKDEVVHPRRELSEQYACEKPCSSAGDSPVREVIRVPTRNLHILPSSGNGFLTDIVALLIQTDPKNLSASEVLNQVPKLSNHLLRNLITKYTNSQVMGYVGGNIAERIATLVIEKIKQVFGAKPQPTNRKMITNGQKCLQNEE